jgi:hypothetical protein
MEKTNQRKVYFSGYVMIEANLMVKYLILLSLNNKCYDFRRNKGEPVPLRLSE